MKKSTSIKRLKASKVRKCSGCGKVELSVLRVDYYCDACRAEYNKAYRAITEHIRGIGVVYIIWNVEGKALYVGQTTLLYRMYFHMSGHSNVGLTPEQWAELGASHVTYAFVDGFAKSSKELRYLEQLYIQHHNPQFHRDRKTVSLDADREMELEHIFEFDKLDFQTMQLDTEELKDGIVHRHELRFIEPTSDSNLHIAI